MGVGVRVNRSWGGAGLKLKASKGEITFKYELM